MTNNWQSTAKRFIERLKTYQSPAEREKIQRYFKTPGNGEVDQFIGVRMGQVFSLAKEFIAMTPDEIEKLLESKIHEVRAGGCSIMDKQARSKKTSPAQNKAPDLIFRGNKRASGRVLKVDRVKGDTYATNSPGFEKRFDRILTKHTI